MIIVKISGGLGNQLFQYAFGKYIASQLNTKVLYDIQTIKNFNHFTPRSIGLTFFECQIEIASKNEIKKMKLFTHGFMERIERKIAKSYPFLFSKYFVEQSSHTITNSRYLRDNCYYDGYWQSYKYLEPLISVLRNEIRLKPASQEQKTDLINEIENSQSVSIHIRRGDYITIKKNYNLFGICSKKYYTDAIQYIEGKINNPIFYIFSDDLSWAKENFNGSQYIFVKGNIPAEDLYLMSRCKYNIIANSSFSWWGAWLNTNSDKLVIAPAQWYNPKLKITTNNLIPETWIQI